MFRLLALAGAVALAHAAQMPHIKTQSGDFNVYAEKFTVARSKTYTVDSRDLEDKNQALLADIAEFDKTANALLATGGDIDKFSSDAESADAAGAAEEVNDALESIDAKVSAWTEQHEKDQAAVSDVIDTFADSNWDKTVTDLLDGLRDELMADIKAGKQSALSKQEAHNKAEMDLKGAQEDLSASLAAYEACTSKGMLYRNGECALAMPAGGVMTKVTQRMFNNGDGRDSGYINNRHITFKKLQDNTHIRVFYHDNFRVHGHTAHGRWNVMICDANGNGCAECKEPGKLNMWKYGSHQHNWWMNDHVGGSVTGMCIRTDNRVLKKGTYQLKVMLNSNRYDMYTGHNQANGFMVDEVVKA